MKYARNMFQKLRCAQDSKRRPEQPDVPFLAYAFHPGGKTIMVLRPQGTKNEQGNVMNRGNIGLIYTYESYTLSRNGKQ